MVCSIFILVRFVCCSQDGCNWSLDYAVQNHISLIYQFDIDNQRVAAVAKCVFSKAVDTVHWTLCPLDTQIVNSDNSICHL